ncbi:hypothetical protein B2H94_15215 [Clostridium sporogenes]|uniref:Uncharacterized protein n=1 Tax=Clostridium sporogenes TaxID=1509 RepID=A0ABD6RTZ3_CLOSG|nr:hypothetical protein B2H94_15215 [Clostridium sporogenes]
MFFSQDIVNYIILVYKTKDSYIVKYEYKNGTVALRINPTIYCVNFKFAKQYIVCKFFNATAPLNHVFGRTHV